MYTPTSSTIRRNCRKPFSNQPVKIILNKGRARMPTPIQSISHINSLALISRKGVSEDEVGKVTTFELGITIDVPHDLTLQLIATPSLIAHGYMLPNGIIFVQSKVPLTVQLYKFREAPDLELPYDGLYLIPHRLNSFLMKRVEKPQPRRTAEAFDFDQEVPSSSIFNDQQQENILT